MEQVSMSEVERKARGHWFSQGAMSFFKSRLPQDAYLVDGVYYFVSSEKGPNMPRLYTIRTMGNDGQVKTVGEFQAYTTKARALSALKHIAGSK